VTGAPVSLAARIMEQTPAGEVWVADPVVQAMGERIDAELLNDISIAALGEPLAVWRLNGIGRVIRARAIAFTGRATEASTAGATLTRVLDRRQGHLLLIEGDAGIGKSRLLAHVLELATARGFAVHLARALDFGGGPAAEPVRALLSSVLDVPSDGDPVLRARRLDESVERLVLTASLRPPLGDLLDLMPRGDDAALWDAMDDAARARARARQNAAIRVVAAAVRQRPIALAVDDLHWADAGTCRMLEAIARGTRDQPLLLVIGTRPRVEDAPDRWRDTLGEDALTEFRLGPFKPDEALRLAWGYGVDDPDFLQDCVVRSRGHPLFLDQLLRYGARGDAVPGSIQNVVLARLDTLPAAERRALQAAAVLGQRFSPGALTVLLDDPDYRPDLLLAQSLLRDEGEELAFPHVLIQEAVAASMLRDARAELHIRAARHFAGREDALAAEHLAAAGDPGAAPAFLDAAKREAARNQSERALRFAKRGLESRSGTCPRGRAAVPRRRFPVRLGFDARFARSLSSGVRACGHRRGTLPRIAGPRCRLARPRPPDGGARSPGRGRAARGPTGGRAHAGAAADPARQRLLPDRAVRRMPAGLRTCFAARGTRRRSRPGGSIPGRARRCALPAWTVAERAPDVQWLCRRRARTPVGAGRGVESADARTDARSQGRARHGSDVGRAGQGARTVARGSTRRRPGRHRVGRDPQGFG